MSSPGLIPKHEASRRGKLQWLLNLETLGGSCPLHFLPCWAARGDAKRRGISLILSSSGLAQALPCWNFLDLVGTFENEVSLAVIALVGHWTVAGSFSATPMG